MASSQGEVVELATSLVTNGDRGDIELWRSGLKLVLLLSKSVVKDEARRDSFCLNAQVD